MSRFSDDQWLRAALIACATAMIASIAAGDDHPWVTRGFEAFAAGTFDAAGANLYVSRNGRVQMIKVWDVNHDGHVDLFFGQSHDLVEYQPARIYFQRDGRVAPESARELPTLHAATLCAGDLDGDGFTDVVVVNDMWVPEPAIATYIYWGGPEGLSAKHRTSIPTFAATAAFAADLNGDGLKEIIVVNRQRPRFDLPGGCIAIHWQTARGLFPVDRRDDLVFASVGAVDMADIDGDGFADLVFHGRPEPADLSPAAMPILDAIGSSPEAENVFLLAGRKGGFEPVQPLALRGDRAGRPRLLRLAGRPHLVMLTDNAIDLYAFSGLEVGPPTALPVPGVRRIAAGDLDGDGRDDLVCATEDRVAVLRGTEGGYDAEAAWTVTLGASDIAVGDLGGDGRPELAVAVPRDGKRYRAMSRVYLNGESGLDAGRHVDLQTSGASEVRIADLDGDGADDVLFACSMGGDASLTPPARVYYGSAEGTYGPGRHVDLPAVSAFGGFMADYDDDGRGDLLVTNQYEGMGRTDQVSLIYLGGPGGLSPERVWRVSAEHAYIPAVADINRDGWLDIVIGAVEGATTYVHWGGPEGYAPQRRQPIPLGDVDGIHLADLDKDGWLDLVYAALEHQAVYILPGDRDGFDPQRRVTLPTALGGSGLESADLDGNGWLDLVVSGWSNPRKGFAATNVPSYIWWGSADGFTPTRRTEFLLQGAAHDVAISDLNQDGHLDIVCSNYDQGISRIFPSYILWGNAACAYATQDVTRLLQAAALGIAVADLNHDGWPEIAFANHNPGGDHRTFSRIHWNRQGSFSDADVTLLPTVGAHNMIAADLGHAYTRRLEETYTSAPFERRGTGRFRRISWVADEPSGTTIVFQVRSAPTRAALAGAPWVGPEGAASCFAASGASLRMLPEDHPWIQYRAILRTPDGAATPALTEVRVDH